MAGVLKTSYFQGRGLLADTAVLLLSNIIVKGLGFAYRVVLVRRLGTEGMGLIEMVTPLFAFLIVCSGLGVQTALTQLSAKYPAKRRDYFLVSRRLLLISSLLVSGLGLLFSPFIASCFISDMRALAAFRCIIPAVVIIAAAASYRGLLQGCGQARSLATSQNCEQVVRVAVGLVLARLLLPWGLEAAACAASLASVAGEAIGFLALLLAYRRLGLQEQKPAPRLTWSQQLRAARELLAYGLPITGGRLAATAIMALQALLIPLALQRAGWDSRAATELYGQFSGVAMSLLHLPGVFTSALTVTMMPAVAASSDPGLLRRRIDATLSAAISFTLPGLVLLWLFADAYCTLIFHNAPAAPLLRILAGGGIFFYVQAAVISVLQGLGQVRRLLLNNLLSGGLTLALVWIFIIYGGWGAAGAAAAVSAGWLAGFLLNYGYMAQLTRCWGLCSAAALRPLAAALLTSLAYSLCRPLLAGLWGEGLGYMLTGTLLVGSLYLLLLAALGGMRRWAQPRTTDNDV